MRREPHDILGIDRHATRDEARRAWRRAAKQLHPDANGGEDKEGRFAELLSLREWAERSEQPSIPLMTVSASLPLLLRGGRLEKPSQARERCPVCSGAGTLTKRSCPACGGAGSHLRTGTITADIPKGTMDGAILPGTFSFPGISAAVDIRIEEEPHPAFKRRGLDLIGRIVLPARLARKGGIVEIEGPDGAQHRLDIPANTSTGHQIPFCGLGIVHPDDRSRGALVLDVIVAAPRRSVARLKRPRFRIPSFFAMLSRR